MTVTEIARRAGVSIGTVDRVLHNRGRVSPETKKRIQTIIDEEGYQPNKLARHLKCHTEYHIGVLIPDLEGESRYWFQIYKGIQDAAKELAPFSFQLELYDFVRPNRNSFAAAFSQMEKAECNAWIIAPVLQNETLVTLLDAKKINPYVLIDSPLPGATPLTSVLQDPWHGGYLAGKLTEMISRSMYNTESDGVFVVLRPYTEAFNLNERAHGFTDWFSEHSGLRVLDIICPDDTDAEIDRILQETVSREPNIQGIFAVSSIGHRIADVVYEYGLKKKIAIVGYDLVEKNIEDLKEGKIDCLISQRPEEQGRDALYQLYRHLVLEETPETEIKMPFDIYFKENLI